MKKYYFLIIVALILGLALTGCTLLSNVGQVPATEQSGITYLTKGLSSNLVGLWHFDDNADDSSGNNNDGTVNGFPAYFDSPMGRALSFNGTDNYVEVGHTDSLDMTSAYTLEAWVNVTDVPHNIYRPIFVRGATDVNDIEVYVQAVSNNLIVVHNRGNGGTFDGVGFDDPPIGEWFHLAVTFDGTDVRAYYDGILATVIQKTTAMTAPSDTDKDWWIGKVDHTAFGTLFGGNDTNLFKGFIDEVRIWNEALTAGEIAYNYVLGGILIDIKPGSDPNNINLKSKGVVPVAILGSDTFDVTDVDVTTLVFGPYNANPDHNLTDPIVYADHLQDVSLDGFTDLVCHFRTQETGIAQGDTSATLTGFTIGGLPFTSTDSVRIVGK